MFKFVVDTMGSDFGSSIVVDAIKNFLLKHKNVSIVAVGKKNELASLESVCEIVDAQDVIPMDAGALETLRMKNSSMITGINYMKENNCDAIISAGSTGAFLAASTIILHTLPGVKRAALVTSFPTKIKNKKVVILDIGANNENSAEELASFALMGRLYSQCVNGIKNPKTYLINNGKEDGKGAPQYKKAFQILKENNFPGFMGNIEARYVTNGEADVIVTDGFTGNIFLKGSEGVARYILNTIQDVFKKNIFTKISYLSAKNSMNEITNAIDYRSTGGGMLLGVNGIVVKAHGDSDSKGFANALELAYKLATSKVVDKIKEGFKNE